MRSTLFWVCAVAAVGAVCAFPRNGRDDKGDKKVPCDDASNPCQDGKTCVLGRCRRACNDSDDCSRGKRCGDDGFCAREKDGCDFGKFGGFGGFGGHHGNFSCDAAKPCREGATCVEGKCQITCSDDTKCPSWKTCQSGVCKHKPQCDASKPCSGGRACVNERCLFPCSADEVCDPWNKCQEGHCAHKEDDSMFNYDDWWKCDSSAATDSCKEGRKCVEGKCSSPCSADADCQAFSFFFGKHHKKVCSNGFCVKEKKEGDDKKGKHHCDDATPCTEQGKVCNEGRCRTPCSATTPCPEGKFCDMKESSASAPSTSTSTEAGFCRREHKCKGFGWGHGHKGGKKCDDSKKCDDGKECVNSVCLRKCDQGNKCRFGKECSADGYCHRINLTCSVETDCSNGRKCVENFCRTPCDDKTACPDKLTCKEGFCRFEGFFGLHSKRQSCDASKPCSDAGKVCIENRCRHACAADKPCDHGKTCSKDGYCTRQDNEDNADQANDANDDDDNDDDDENEPEQA